MFSNNCPKALGQLPTMFSNNCPLEKYLANRPKARNLLVKVLYIKASI